MDVYFCGSNRTDYSKEVREAVYSLPSDAVVVTSCTRGYSGVEGVDALAERYARERGLAFDGQPFRWESLFSLLLVSIDKVHAFYDGNPGNTHALVVLAKRLGIPVIAVHGGHP